MNSHYKSSLPLGFLVQMPQGLLAMRFCMAAGHGEAWCCCCLWCKRSVGCQNCIRAWWDHENEPSENQGGRNIVRCACGGSGHLRGLLVAKCGEGLTGNRGRGCRSTPPQNYLNLTYPLLIHIYWASGDEHCPNTSACSIASLSFLLKSL